MLVYGQSKVGKTTLLMNLVDPWLDKSTKEGPVCYLISADRGTKKIHMGGAKYNKRIAVTYPDTLAEWRIMVAELARERIAKVVKSKSPRDVWVVVDTVTHMQNNLMTEARSIDVRHFSPKRNERAKPEDVFVRDATTQVDWNINLTHMGELTNILLKLPCNILLIALEKESRDSAGRTTYAPALSGQSREKIIGDADVVARMIIDPKDNSKRVLLTTSGPSWVAGDRTGKLGASEPADLAYIQSKIFDETAEVVVQPETVQTVQTN